MQPSFNDRSVITNATTMMEQQSNNNNALGNPAAQNQSRVIGGDLSSNLHAINSPAKLTLDRTSAPSSTQIPGEDALFKSLGGLSSGIQSNTGTQSSGGMSGSQATSNSGHEVSGPNNVTSTWSKFAQQTTVSSQPIESNRTLDSFQQFKKQAKEKQDKEKLIEMQEQRRREREQQEREQQEREQAERERLSQEQKIDQEGEMALSSLVRSEQSPVLSPASDCQSPASVAGTSGGGSNMLKLREQERRKREALASQNQMDLSRQSEIMSKFEDH